MGRVGKFERNKESVGTMDFVESRVLLRPDEREQGGAGQPATRSESE